MDLVAVEHALRERRRDLRDRLAGPAAARCAGGARGAMSGVRAFDAERARGAR
jgi:hypothetical protein